MFKRFQVNKYVGMALLLCFLLKAEQRWHFPNIYLDTLAQAASFANYSSGRGWVAFDEDFGQLTSMHRFPPLYVMVPAGIKSLGFARWADAVRMADILFLWLSLLAIICIALGLGLEKKRFLALIFLAFVLPPFQYLTSSGLMALACFSWAVYFLLLHKNERQSKWIAVSLLSLLIWIRPAYLPFLAVFPLYQLLQGWLGGEKIDPWRMLLFLLPLGLSAAFLLYWQSLGPNLLPSEKGFYPQHLLNLSPFPLKSFLYWAWPQELSMRSHFSAYWGGVKIFLWLLSLTLLWWLGRGWRKKSRLHKNYFYLATLTLALNVGFLCFLSLTQASEHWNEAFSWTYVREDRYFGPSMCLLLLAFLVKSEHSRYFQRTMAALALLYGGFFLWSRIELYGTNQSEWGFGSSYTHVLEGELIQLQRQGITAVQLSNDNNNYLLEAHGLSPYQARDKEPIRYFALFSIEAKKDIPEGHRLVSERGKWIFVEILENESDLSLPLKD